MNKKITRDTDGLTKVPKKKHNWMAGFVIPPSHTKDIDMVELDRFNRVRNYLNEIRK